jgi:hypothetical protein
MSEALATRGPLSTNIEQVLIGGDLAQLKPEERLNYYNHLCQSLGLNSLTQPFQYIVLNGKLQLYAKKDCTEQLRKIHGVSITSVDPKQIGDLLVVVASASDRDGRVDSSTGAVNLSGLKGENLANAMMKAETKAKRRVTLSLCGLGMLDETEVDTLKQQGVASEPQGNNWQAPDPTQPANVTNSTTMMTPPSTTGGSGSGTSVISHQPAKPTSTQQSAQQVTQRAEAPQQAAQPQAGAVKFIPPNGLTVTVRSVQVPNEEKLAELKERKIKPSALVTFLGTHAGCDIASCFDTKFWPLLKECIGLECHFQIKEADKNDRHFINIVDVIYVDGCEYKDAKPVIAGEIEENYSPFQGDQQ